MAPKGNKAKPESPPPPQEEKKADKQEKKDDSQPPTHRSGVREDYDRTKKSLYTARGRIEQSYHDPQEYQPYTWTSGIKAYTNTSVSDVAFKQDASPRKPKPYGMRPHETLEYDGFRESTIVPVTPSTSHKMDTRYRVSTKHNQEADSSREKKDSSGSRKEDKKVNSKSGDNEKKGQSNAQKKEDQKEFDQKKGQKSQNPPEEKQKKGPENQKDDEQKKGQQNQNEDKQNKGKQDQNKKGDKQEKSQQEQNETDEKDRKEKKEDDEPRYMKIPYQLPRERRVEFQPLEILKKKSKDELNYDDIKAIRREVRQQQEEKKKKRREENYELVQRDWDEMNFDDLYELRLEADKKRLHFPVINYFGTFKKGARQAATEKAEPLDPDANTDDYTKLSQLVGKINN